MKDKLLALATVAAMVFGIAASHLIAGTDRIQGTPQRIFYVHVPAAWIAFFAFFLVFLFSLLYLWKNARTYDLWAHA
ncbi:MAG: cytochrome c biogenesis protein CcsA, partial [Nitrospinota bacterium]